MKYNLNDLHWQQFEIFSFKCLQKLISTGIQFLEGGNDKGRDIIYEGSSIKFNPLWNGKWVIQIKHKSLNSTNQTRSINSLLSDLNVELEKVFLKNKLEINNYIIVTNILVTPDLEDKAHQIFNGFCEKSGIHCENFFIIGYRHLESCVDDNPNLKWDFPSIISHPDFELLFKSHFESVIDNRNIGWMRTISKYRKYFVYTNFYQEVLEKLKNHHTILLSGPPKSGKTFNAEILAFNYAGENLFRPLKIDTPDEVEKYYNREFCQIFICDDAFGSHRLSYSNAEDWDRKIEGILSLGDERHKFIFISREHVFRAFKNFAKNFSDKHLEKIVVNNDKLSLSEKSAILDKYVQLSNLSSDKKSSIIAIENTIICHEKFTPETIRSFFANVSSDCESKYSIGHHLLDHLNKPDEYLTKLFFQLDESKRILLLGVLCSLNPEIKEIGKVYSNLCNDFGTHTVESYKFILEELDGGILKSNQNSNFVEVDYFHPSMKEVLIDIIKKDENGTIHNSVLKNLNLELLDFYFFDSPKTKRSKVIGIKQFELESLSLCFNRLFNNEAFQFYHILRLLKWFTNSANSLIKVLDKPFQNLIVKLIFGMMDYIKSKDFWEKYRKETISNWAELIWCIKSLGLVYSLDLKLLFCDYWIVILKERKDDIDYWKVVFRISNFMDEREVISIVNRDWLNSFYLQLKNQIVELGNEIYGSAFPDFHSLKAEEKKFPSMFHKMNHKPNRTWYPRFILCKEKIMYLKDIKGNKIGQPIIERVQKEYEIILRISDYANNRHSFNEEKEWW